MSKNIKLIRLSTREDILAEIIHEGEHSYEIKNPIRVIVIPLDPRIQAGTEKSPQIGFAPWIDFTSDTKFKIDKLHVITTSEPVKEFLSQYNTMFTGIITPQSGLISL